MVRRDWSGVRRKRALAPLVALSALGLATLGVASPSGAQTTTVNGSAFGFSISVSLLDSPIKTAGPVPTVTLPEGGSATPVTASAPSGDGTFAPANFFTSGKLDVSTEGTPAGGTVTSSAKIADVNTSGQEALTASAMSSTCTASAAGGTGSATVTGGTVLTDSGDDDTRNTIPDHAPVTVPVPENPAPGTTIEGHIHVNGTTDNFKYVFNEQVTSSDGSITVNAAHEFLLGPSAKGDLFIGQSVCGIGTASATTTTLPGSETTTTVAGGDTGGGTGGGSTSGGGSGMAKTGTDVFPLTFLGLELVVAGWVAVRWAGRHRIWPLR